jgi:hypothetical protein
MIAALAAGDLAAWTGLEPGLTRETVAAALGPADPDRDFGGRFAGEPRPFRHYAATPAAPAGIDVWFSGTQAVAITFAPANVTPDSLGPPETIAGHDAVRTHVYAGRGLALEVARDGAVERVIGFAPTTTAAFLAGPLATR